MTIFEFCSTNYSVREHTKNTWVHMLSERFRLGTGATGLLSRSLDHNQDWNQKPFGSFGPSSHKCFCNLVLQNNIGQSVRTTGGGAVFTCAGEAVLHHSCCFDALPVMREAELELTAKLQPPEGLAAFCRLIFVGELLQLKVRRMKSPDIYLSVKV